MRAYIGKQIRYYRKNNGWILLELVLVFVLAWIVSENFFTSRLWALLPDGWNPERVYSVDVALKPDAEPESGEALEADFRRLQDALSRISGVQYVAPHGGFYPGSYNNRDIGFAPEGQTGDLRQISPFWVKSYECVAGTDFLKVFGIETDGDIFQPETVLITEDIAEWLASGGHSLQRIRTGGYNDRDGQLTEVAGRIPRLKPGSASSNYESVILRVLPRIDAETIEDELAGFCVRIAGGVSEEEILRKLYAETEWLHTQVPVSLEFRFRDNSGQGLFKVGLFFLLANLLLGFLSFYLMRTRSRLDEIGIRLALGARPDLIRRQFLGEAWLLTGIAVLIGSVLAFNYRLIVVPGQFQGNPFLLAPWPWMADWRLADLLRTVAVVLVMGLTVTVSTLFAVWSPSRMAPSEAMREE